MIVNSHWHDLFRVFLSDDEFIEKFVDLGKKLLVETVGGMNERRKPFLVLAVVDVFSFFLLSVFSLRHFPRERRRNDYISHIEQISSKLKNVQSTNIRCAQQIARLLTNKTLNMCTNIPTFRAMKCHITWTIISTPSCKKNVPSSRLIRTFSRYLVNFDQDFVYSTNCYSIGWERYSIKNTDDVEKFYMHNTLVVKNELEVRLRAKIKDEETNPFQVPTQIMMK